MDFLWIAVARIKRGQASHLFPKVKQYEQIFTLITAIDFHNLIKFLWRVTYLHELRIILASGLGHRKSSTHRGSTVSRSDQTDTPLSHVFSRAQIGLHEVILKVLIALPLIPRQKKNRYIPYFFEYKPRLLFIFVVILCGFYSRAAFIIFCHRTIKRAKRISSRQKYFKFTTAWKYPTVGI